MFVGEVEVCVCAHTCVGQERASNPPALELQAIMMYPIQVLGTELSPLGEHS